MAQLRCHITRSARLSAVSLRALMLALFVATVHASPASADKETTDTMTASSEHKPRPTIPDAAVLKTLPPDGGPGWNRLVFEKSPYLQQHAANPVDWYPWGEEAFAEARRRDVPVFLSVGYSTCHWCHVMEHESFEDPQVAALMNEAFVCVKVDREERPDIDHVYMTVTQAMTGSGGWPMTVIMTADKKPFFAGTYFPKDGRYGRPGMMELVPHIQEIWKSNRKRLTETADYISGELGKLSTSAAGDAPDQRLLDAAFEQFRERFDPYRGGFNERPKFPVPHNLSFLLRYWKRTGNPEALKMAEYTLERMSFGGINDQVGRGFHRYSTDERWLLPHFEKMLYDQALLAIAYTDAHQATGKDLYRQNAEQILEYVSRDLTAPEGGFYSAEDADSEGEEGKFYVWSVEEVMQVLGNEEGMLFCKVFNFEADGNFHDERTGANSGVNIPYLTRPVAEVAHQMNKTPEDVVPRIEAARRKLFLHREARVHPFKDDKILTDWNGLMIAAYARAANAFDEPRYAETARRAADFCLATLRTPDGRLLKRYRQGEAGLPAHLEDYTFLTYGLVELYEATFDPKYLAAACELADTMIARFHDDGDGAFFHTADDGEQLLVRSKDVYDGAIPSGNAVAATVLAKLGRMTGRADYEKAAAEVLEAFAGGYQRGASQFSQSMMALDFAIGPTREVVLAGDLADPELQAMRREIWRTFDPNLVVLHRPAAEDSPIIKLSEFLKHNGPIDGKPTAYVCQDFHCEAPVTTAAALRTSLQAK